MTLRRVGLSNSLSSQAKISNKRFTLSRVSLRRFPFPTAPAAPIIPIYIEEVFSTFLYSGSGTGTQQTITNGIDLANKGGLVWGKIRNIGDDHYLFDTLRGGNQGIRTNTSGFSGASGIADFTSTGFIVKDSLNNTSARTFVSWTFRKQAKFFDVVTYTGNGTGQNISHALGSVPGCIFIKRTDASADWRSYHRGIGNPGEGGSFGTAQWSNLAAALDGSVPTDTTFSPASGANTNGASYVAYLFAHDSGGFGATGSDNVISCGGYVTTTGATQDINLGFEPQWVLITRAYGAGAVSGWFLFDDMREMSYSDNVYLAPNSTAAESAIGGVWIRPTSTGFTVSGGLNGSGTAGYTFVYIAIRRGPMKTPTTGTSVFDTLLWVGNNSTQNITGLNFPPDLLIGTTRNYNYGNVYERIRGSSRFFQTTTQDGDSVTSSGKDLTAFLQNGFSLGQPLQTALNNNATAAVMWNFRRAPGFLDVVPYTGTGVAGRTVTHNLGVVPELIIVKRRDTTSDWYVYSATTTATDYLLLNSIAGRSLSAPTVWNNTEPTSSVFTLGTTTNSGGGGTYVAYLFASCPGVSKVGSYTGTGTTQSINCGFTSGARFVMIKRINNSTTGGWFIWDSARGIIAGNDPYLLLNGIAAEVTNTDYIDTYSAGFEISSTAPVQINNNGEPYIFLAIA